MSPTFIILYVNNIKASTDFYTDLLGRSPVESSPNFAGFALESGVFLGLWSKAVVEPATAVMGGGTELGFGANDAAAVDAMHDDWRARHIQIAQAPTQMDFGYTFVGLDPDGHRLRVMFSQSNG